MPFIPFLDKQGVPIGANTKMVKSRMYIDVTGLEGICVAPEHLEQAKMVIRNQLLELFLDHLLGKPNNEQTAYEANALAAQYNRQLLQDGGIKW